MPRGGRACSLVAAVLMLAATVGAAASSADTDAALAQWRATLQLMPDRARGETLFATCAACHGADGMGQRDGAVPVIAGQHREVLLRQLVDYRQGRRWDLRMEHVVHLRRLQTLNDLADVADFIAALPANGVVGTGNGIHLDSGAAIYLERCADCHGATGQGDAGRGIARLAAQHQAYLVRQFLDVVEGRRPPLSATHDKSMSGLDQAQIDGIADYLSRMQSRR